VVLRFEKAGVMGGLKGKRVVPGVGEERKGNLTREAEILTI